MTADGNWKRLFPIRFRRLQGDQSFKRWDIVEFDYRKHASDHRPESCRVHEESIHIVGRTKKSAEKASLVARALTPSEKYASAEDMSLALIRPKNVRFASKKRTDVELNKMRERFAAQSAQLSLIEEEIAAYEPCPYEFTMHYFDEDGPHRKTCSDWETSATFFNHRRKYGEEATLRHLEKTYCHDYVESGLYFAIGNMKKRPKTWQLLGIFPVKSTKQQDLFP
ncbi:MAG: hypothetical protein GKR98_06750 [Boseongicola sp.]|nr:MAG: hypothetical protein GKR98_06750 [Boseongicola sp.]